MSMFSLIKRFFSRFNLDFESMCDLLESETDALVLVNSNNEVVYINNKAKQFFGTSYLNKIDIVEALTSRSVLDVESNDISFAKIKASLEKRIDIKVELILKSKFENDDTSWEWYDVSYKKINEKNSLWRIHSTTKKNVLFSTYKQEIKELSNLLDNADVGFYTSDAGGDLQYVNQRLCNWLGYSDFKELKNKGLLSLSDIFAGDLAVELDGLWNGQAFFKTQSGNRIPLYVMHSMYDENGETKYSGCVIRDLKCSVGNDEEIERERLILFEDAPMGIAFVDNKNDNIITKANSQLAKLFGKDIEELKDAHLIDLFPENAQKELSEKMSRFLFSKPVKFQVETRFLQEDKVNGEKKEKNVILYINPITEENEGYKELSGFVIYFVDNTEQKIFFERQMQVKKEESIATVSGGIAHDVNNCLTAIINSTQLLQQIHTENNPDNQTYRLILDASNRASNLVRQLMNLTSVKQKVFAYYLVEELFDYSLKFNLDIIMQKKSNKLDVSFSIGQNLGYVYVNKDELVTVITNLAHNARDAMEKKGGTFKIRVSKKRMGAGKYIGNEEVVPGNYIVIEASDTGCGMTEEVKKRIFDVCFSTKKKGYDSGQGMGMSLVLNTIKSFNGYIDVKSKVDIGTTFYLFLPHKTEQDAAEQLNAEKEANQISVEEASKLYNVVHKKEKVKSKEGQLSFEFSDEKKKLASLPKIVKDLTGTERILLVDDDDNVRMVTKKVLSVKGYSVVDCICAEEALDLLEKDSNFNLIITDMVMTGMDGMEMTDVIRSKGIKTDVLLVSGYSEKGARGEIVESENFYFLPKPFDIKQLCEKVKNILTSPKE
ncbi:MAG: response regulator [Alphaproteobacteria bacterium]|nr:response regulator [Alphaproteobacteria bacterium]